jgi:hypothetical protein
MTTLLLSLAMLASMGAGLLTKDRIHLQNPSPDRIHLHDHVQDQDRLHDGSCK